MKIFSTIGVLLLVVLSSCNQNSSSPAAGAHDHEHEELKVNYTAYSQELELFAEADPFVLGEQANVLSHFSTVSDFKPVREGAMTLTLTVGTKSVSQRLDNPTRNGIYSFDLKPEVAGAARLKYEWESPSGGIKVVEIDAVVYPSDHEAHEAVESVVISRTNTSVFTKEQSWKIDFATALPSVVPFGQVIRATAMVEPSQGDEMIVVAKIPGVVSMQGGVLTEGSAVTAGRSLFTVRGSGVDDQNITVRSAEIKNRYTRAKSEYERAQQLAADKIVSERELVVARTEYENAKAMYENLQQNYGASGQSVVAPMTGFVKQIFVRNGEAVQAGQRLMVVAQDKSLMLKAELQPKYASLLQSLSTATIELPSGGQKYSLESLGGKIVSVGKSTGGDGYLIPVYLQISNSGEFVPGTFVNLYLKAAATGETLTIPEEALLEEQGNYFVYVQIHPELFEKRQVRIGATDGLLVEVVKGVNAQERVVTNGAMMIRLAQSTGALDAHSGHVH